MGWFRNFSLVMRSSVTTLREKFENPERMINQLVIDMEEELERVRASVAEAIADEIQLGRKAEKTREETQQWMDRATKSLKREDEKSAKAALEQKGLAQQRADRLEEEHLKQKEQTAKLQRSVRDLDDKIRQARQKRSLLLARLARADSTQKVNQALHQADSRSAFAQFSRLEQKVDRAEAMSEAYDRLEDRDPDAAELERQFEEQERKQLLEKEFEELKSRVDIESGT